MTDYYDPDGKPISFDEWTALFQKRTVGGDDSWWRRQTKVKQDVEVSTVWLGIDHNFGSGDPLFWETMIFRDGYGDEQWRYSSKDEAMRDHNRIVVALLRGVDPDNYDTNELT